MEHVHSIIIVKKNDKYLNYYDERWGMYLFPSIKGNDIEEIKSKYKTDEVNLLFDVIHNKYSVPHDEMRAYHHYFYQVNGDIDGEYFSLEELLQKPKVKKFNGDIISYIEKYFNN